MSHRQCQKEKWKEKKISSVHPGMTPCTFGFHRKVYFRQENESVGIKSGSWRTHTSSARYTHFRWGLGRPLPIKCHKSSSYGADKNRSTVLQAFEDGGAAASLLWFSRTRAIGASARFVLLEDVALFLWWLVQYVWSWKMSSQPTMLSVCVFNLKFWQAENTFNCW